MSSLTGLRPVDILRSAVADFHNVSALDARVLLLHVLGWSREELIARDNEPLVEAQVEKFLALLQRRANGEPVSQIVQHKEFWGLDFTVTGDVLTPRPDSETLIELALELFPQNAPKTILDIGTGSGCLLASLLSEFDEARGTALDISKDAIKIAAQNFQDLRFASRIDLYQADYRDEVRGEYDLVVSNPPYIAESERPGLAIDVREYEPEIALFAGDGYDAYRTLSQLLPALLSTNGVAVLEVGDGQAATVCNMLQSGFDAAGRKVQVVQRRDLAGIPRAIGVISSI